jgi:hypothetical protein
VDRVEALKMTMKTFVKRLKQPSSKMITIKLLIDDERCEILSFLLEGDFFAEVPEAIDKISSALKGRRIEMLSEIMMLISGLISEAKIIGYDEEELIRNIELILKEALKDCVGR